MAQTNPTSDQTNLKNLYYSSGGWIKSFYLAGAKGSTLQSDDYILTLTLASYATASDITTALARYATTTQLSTNWLDTLTAITNHQLTVAQQNQILTQVYTRGYIDFVFAATDVDINTKNDTLQVNGATGQQLLTTTGGTTAISSQWRCSPSFLTRITCNSRLTATRKAKETPATGRQVTICSR